MSLMPNPYYTSNVHRSSVTVDTCTRLNCRHFPSLHQQLSQHATKWYEIGLELGFTHKELNVIQNAALFVDDGLGEMLSQWLEWFPGDGRKTTSVATLEELKHALRRVGLGLTAETLYITI